ncbi:MAG TPA: Mu transposase C-terminal domain-containing protein [Rhizomicrobium sp.]|jgi:transposase InsO family protein
MSALVIGTEKQWLTAAEVAAEGLPGLSGSKRHVNRIITAAGIKCRRRQARGGGREFHWSELPREAREEYLKRHGVCGLDETNVSPRAREAQKDLRVEARVAIVEACAAFLEGRRSTKAKGLAAFCAAYERASIKLPDWVLRTEPTLAPHHLRTWERLLRKDGPGALADRRGRPSGSSLFERDTALRHFVIAAIASRPHISAPLVVQLLAADLGRHIPLRTVQAFMANLRETHAPTLKALANPDKYRSHHKPAFGSLSASIVRINQRWEIDGTRADAMCVLPDGSRRRMALIALIDVFTRRAMVLVTDEGRAAATKALLRRAILAWGLPEVLKADNGKDFTAADVMSFCREVGISVKLSRAFHPEEKGHIERFFGSLNRGLFPMLPGFVGHNVGDRKAIEARETYAHRFGEEARLAIETTLTPAQLQARIDAWLHDIYEPRNHGDLGCAPAAKANAHADQAKRIADERALDALLLSPPDGHGLRVVLKRGISVSGRNYIAPELGAHMGQRVHVRLDPYDLSRIVVFSRDGSTFLCVAEDAEAISNDYRMQIAKGAQSAMRRHLRLVRDDAREIQATYPSAGAADRILRHAGGDSFVLSGEAAEAMQAAQTPRLIENSRATAALEASVRPAEPIAASEEERTSAEEAFAEIDALRAAPKERAVQCDGYERPAFEGDDIGFWHWARARIERRELVDDQDLAVLESLRTDSGFQLQLRIATTTQGAVA